MKKTWKYTKKFAEDMYKSLGVWFLLFVAMETPAGSVIPESWTLMTVWVVERLMLPSIQTGRQKVSIWTHGMTTTGITTIPIRFPRISQPPKFLVPYPIWIRMSLGNQSSKTPCSFPADKVGGSGAKGW